jgi:hypothetical protein
MRKQKYNIDLTGQKLHLLTPLTSFKKDKHIYWECICECGEISNVRAGDLINGKIKSCGCLRKQTILSRQQVAEAYFLYIEEKLPIRIIAGIFKCSERTIEGSFKRNNYAVRDRSHQHRKYDINENIFDVLDTEEKAYWLGFLYADGSITDHRCVSVHLAEKDENHLEKFSNFIYGCNRIRDYLTEDGRRIVYLHVYNKQLSSRLIELGCVPNKTFVLKFPEWLEENLVSHFVRGYFDGDGSIGIYDYKIPSRKGGYTGSIYRKASFCVLSTKELLLSFKKLFAVRCHLGKRHKDRDNNNFTLTIGGNRKIEKVLNWIYKDATIYLSRKYEKYLELKQFNLSKNT